MNPQKGSGAKKSGPGRRAFFLQATAFTTGNVATTVSA
jgi:hypothetical protein